MSVCFLYYTFIGPQDLVEACLSRWEFVYQRNMSEVKFNLGEKVFAKLKGYCAWPAKVEGVADLTPKRVKYHVYFYGTKQIAVCREEDLFSYCKYKNKYGKPKKLKYFNASIDEIEADTESVNIDSVDKPIPVLNSDESRLLESSMTYSPKNSKEGIMRRPRPTTNLSELHLDPAALDKKQTLLRPKSDEYDTQYLKLSALRTEGELLEIQLQIQKNLALEKANPELSLSLKYLDKLISLKMNSLMVKKHSSVIIFLRNLQNYNGNIRARNLSEEEEILFQSQEALIRSKAKVAYDKIQSLFHVPYGLTFQEFFDNEMEKYKKNTASLTFAERLSLT